MKKIACIFNIAPHYREPIYKLLDRELNCDFFIGNQVSTPLKTMDYAELGGLKKILNNIYIGRFYWQSGLFSAKLSYYDHFIIDGEPYCLTTWLLLIYCRIVKKKTYLWTHGWYGKEGRAKSFIKKIFFSMSTKVLLYGNYARDLMISEGFNQNKLSVIYNSLNYDEQKSIKPSKKSILKSHFGNNNFTLIYIGRVQKIKKVDYILKAIDFLRRNHEIILNCVIIGQSTDENEINELITKLQLDSQVWMYGPCFDECEIADLFHDSDLCISPGNVGLTAIHSLTYGVPVLTHNNYAFQMPEFEAIEEGVSGGFFEYDDLVSLSNAILKLSHLKLKQNMPFDIVENCYNAKNQLQIIKSIIYDK